MKLGLAATLESRDGTTAKDAGGRNTIIETEGEASALLKRPGAYSLGAAGSGVGQLLACYKGNLKSIVGNTLADLIVTTYIPMPPAPSISGLPDVGIDNWGPAAYGNGVFVVISRLYGSVATSTDGSGWALSGSIDASGYGAGDFSYMAFGNGIFVLFYETASEIWVFTSSNGSDWTDTGVDIGAISGAVLNTTLQFSGGKFFVLFSDVVAGASGSMSLAKSEDGINWSVFSMDTGFAAGKTIHVSGVAFLSGEYYFSNIDLADSLNLRVSKSSNLSSWSSSLAASNYGKKFGIIASGSNIVVPGLVYSSDGGATWQASSGITSGWVIENLPPVVSTIVGLYTLVYGGSSMAYPQYLYSSVDNGVTWIEVGDLGEDNYFYSIASNSNTVIAISEETLQVAAYVDQAVEPAAVVSIESSQAITSIDPDLPFFAQVAGQAQSENVIVFKNAKEAWVYKT